MFFYHRCLRDPGFSSQDQMKKAAPLGGDDAKNLTRVGILGGSQGEEKGGVPVSCVSHIYLWADICQDRKSTFCQLFHFSTVGWFCLPLAIPWCPASQCRPHQQGTGPRPTDLLHVFSGLAHVMCTPCHPVLSTPLHSAQASVKPCIPALIA